MLCGGGGGGGGGWFPTCICACKVKSSDMLMNSSLHCNCKNNFFRINITHIYLRGPVPKSEITCLKFHIKISFIYFIYLFIYVWLFNAFIAS